MTAALIFNVVLSTVVFTGIVGLLAKHILIQSRAHTAAGTRVVGRRAPAPVAPLAQPAALQS
jgi:hypothetical protein